MLSLLIVEERKKLLDEITEMVYSKAWKTRVIERKVRKFKKALNPELPICQTKWIEKYNEQWKHLLELSKGLEQKKLRKIGSSRRPFNAMDEMRKIDNAKTSAEYQTLSANGIEPPITPNFEETKSRLEWTTMFNEWKKQVLDLVFANNLQSAVNESGRPPIGQVSQ